MDPTAEHQTSVPFQEPPTGAPVPDDLLRRLFDAAAEPMLLLDGDEFADCNRSCLRLFGVGDKGVLRRLRLADVSPPRQPDGRDSGEKAAEMIARARERGWHRFEWVHRRLDTGEDVLVEVGLSAVEDPESGRCLIHAILCDITERRRHEAELEESERRLRRIVENLPAGAVYIAGESMYLNRAAEQITGYGRDELTRLSDWFRALFGEQAGAVRAAYEADRAAGFPETRTIPFRRKDGKIRVLEIAAYHDESGGDICLLHDVTERDRIEKTESEERLLLEQITGATPLPRVLASIAGMLQGHLPGARCAIHLADREGARLYLAAGPDLPPALAGAFRSLRIPHAETELREARGVLAAFLGGPCSPEAAGDETGLIFAPDVAAHPLWKGGAEAAAAQDAGLRAVWGRCIQLPSATTPLGVLTVYFEEVYVPDGAARHLLEMVGHVTAMAVQRRRHEAELQEYAAALRKAKDELEVRVAERTAELEAERARLEAILTQMPAGVVIAESGTGRPLLANRQVGRIWRDDEPEEVGEDPRSLVELGLSFLLKPDLTEYAPDEFPLNVESQPEGGPVEFAIRRYDGTRGTVLASTGPVLDPKTGEPCATVVTLQDITDLKNTEEALRRLHEELEMQVQERTAELALANRALQAEVRERERAEQVSRGQAEALTRTLGALAASVNVGSFVDLVMVAIAEQLRAEGIVFSLYDNDEGEVVIQRAYSDGVRFGPDELAAAGAHVRAPVDSVPLYHELMATRRPIFIEDINLDQRVAMNRHVLQAQGMVSFVLVPLLLGESVVGSFAILSRKRRRFDDAEVELARTLATQATLALQLERMDRQGRHNAILQERNRLAREIHDTLAQGFTSIVIHLQLAEAAMRLKPEKALPAILKARDVARDSLAEARRSVWALRPNALQGSGIADGLRRLCDSMAGSEDAPVRPRVVLEGEARPLPAETEGHLLRLGQEAINNALKYAAARDICVTVTFEAGHVRLCVRDDGRGFDKGDKPRGSGFGHQSMRERVAALGGELHIESAPGAGTTVRVSIPAPSTGPSPSSSLGDGGGGNTPESQTR